MKKALSLLLANILALVSLFSFGASANEAASTRDAVGMSIAGFQSQDLYHNPIDDSILMNADVTVINFWAVWCSPCLAEMPDFKRLDEYYKSTPEADVQIYGLLLYEYSEEITEAIDIFESNGYEWTNILRTPQFYAIAEALIGDGSVPVPQTIIVDRTGTIRAHKRGRFIDYQEMYSYVNGWYELISAENPGPSEPPIETPAPILPGDVNGDGDVTTIDALLALRMAMQLIPPANIEAGDMDGDGSITATDAIIILRAALHLY